MILTRHVGSAGARSGASGGELISWNFPMRWASQVCGKANVCLDASPALGTRPPSWWWRWWPAAALLVVVIKSARLVSVGWSPPPWLVRPPARVGALDVVARPAMSERKCSLLIESLFHWNWPTPTGSVNANASERELEATGLESQLETLEAVGMFALNLLPAPKAKPNTTPVQRRRLENFRSGESHDTRRRLAAGRRRAAAG
jgi:hypothetical protein